MPVVGNQDLPGRLRPGRRAVDEQLAVEAGGVVDAPVGVQSHELHPEPGHTGRVGDEQGGGDTVATAAVGAITQVATTSRTGCPVRASRM
jgi:hypothetical protein